MRNKHQPGKDLVLVARVQVFCFMMRAPIPILLLSSVVFTTTTRPSDTTRHV